MLHCYDCHLSFTTSSAIHCAARSRFARAALCIFSHSVRALARIFSVSSPARCSASAISCSASTLLNRLSAKVRLAHGWSASHGPSPHPLFSTSVFAPVFAACTLPMSVSSGVSTPHASFALALSSTNHPSLDHGRFISSVVSFGRSTLTRLHHAHCAASGCRTSAARRRAPQVAPGPAGLRLMPPSHTHPPAPAPSSTRPCAPPPPAPPASARLRLTPPSLAHSPSSVSSTSPPTRRRCAPTAARSSLFLTRPPHPNY